MRKNGEEEKRERDRRGDEKNKGRLNPFKLNHDFIKVIK